MGDHTQSAARSAAGSDLTLLACAHEGYEQATQVTHVFRDTVT